MQVLGTHVVPRSKSEISKKIQESLLDNRNCTIATLNPEILLTASNDQNFREVLNTQSIHTIDGFGLLWALKFKYGGKDTRMIERLTGIDLMNNLLAKIGREKNADDTIFLIASSKGLSTWKQTAKGIQSIFPRVKCLGKDILVQKQSDLAGDFDQKIIQETVSAIDNSGARYVFCNFGAPNQEYFLDKLKNARLKKSCVYMGVGGSFDFITGNQMRSPLWMQENGLEWIYRLVRQPQRIKRIMRAVFIFPIKVLRDK